MQCGYSEVEDDIVYGDFLALLEACERRVVVLRGSGYMRVGKIAPRSGTEITARCRRRCPESGPRPRRSSGAG